MTACNEDFIDASVLHHASKAQQQADEQVTTRTTTHHRDVRIMRKSLAFVCTFFLSPYLRHILFQLDGDFFGCDQQKQQTVRAAFEVSQLLIADKWEK